MSNQTFSLSRPIQFPISGPNIRLSINKGSESRKSCITTRFRPTAFLLAPLCALIAMAQTKPNFTGTWKLNQQKSKSSDSVTIEFNQKDNNLTQSLSLNAGQDGELEAKYTIDGKESEIPTSDATIKATAKWDGDALVIDFKRA